MGMFLSVYLKITLKKKEGFQTLVETNFIPFHLNKQLLIYNNILKISQKPPHKGLLTKKTPAVTERESA